MKEPTNGLARPVFAVDHLSRTVPDLDGALRFYGDVLGATEIYRIGPLDAAEMPTDDAGRDWMATHVNVPAARLTLAMLRFPDGACLQLVHYDTPPSATAAPRNCDLGGHHIGLRVKDVPAAVAYLEAHGCTAMQPIVVEAGPLAGKTNQYVQDPWGLQLELVD